MSNRKTNTENVFRMVTRTVTLPNPHTPLHIQPFGDVHRFAPLCHVAKWRAFLKWAKREHTPHTLYLSVGDLDDFAAHGERRAIRGAQLHESTTAALDAMARDRVARLIDELAFMRGSFIGAIQGNHHWRYEDGDTSTHEIAAGLGGEWLGDVALVWLSVQFRDRREKIAIRLLIAHGRAGGRLVGTSINQVSDLRSVFPDADIYLMGHDHHKGGWPVSVLYCNRPRDGRLTLHQRRQWLCRSGSFLRGYEPDVSSYVVRRMLRPTDLGIIRFRVDWNRSRSGGANSTVPDIHLWS